MTILKVRVEDELFAQAQEVAGGMGLDLPSAVRLFLRQMVTDNGLPFRPACDPFYSLSNREALQRSLAQLKAGNVVSRTLEELEVGQ